LCGGGVSGLGEEGASCFPGKNGKSAYVGGVIYTINPGGGGKTKVTDGDQPSYSPNGKRIAYRAGGGIYTINVGGGGKFQVTNNNTRDEMPSWGDGSDSFLRSPEK
jgi:Tol biopolymer transport system component